MYMHPTCIQWSCNKLELEPHDWGIVYLLCVPWRPHSECMRLLLQFWVTENGFSEFLLSGSSSPLPASTHCPVSYTGSGQERAYSCTGQLVKHQCSACLKERNIRLNLNKLSQCSSSELLDKGPNSGVRVKLCDRWHAFYLNHSAPHLLFRLCLFPSTGFI